MSRTNSGLNWIKNALLYTEFKSLRVNLLEQGDLGPVHTNAFSKRSVLPKTHQKLRVHHTVVFAAFSPLKRSKALQQSSAHATNIRTRNVCDVNDVNVFESLRFRRLHSGKRFQMYAFSMKMISVFDRCSVDDRRKRIEKYAISNENALAWTGRGLWANRITYRNKWITSYLYPKTVVAWQVSSKLFSLYVSL